MQPTWKVSRRWTWRHIWLSRRWRKSDNKGDISPDSFFFLDFGEGIVVGIVLCLAVIAAALVLIFVVIPLLLLVLDVVAMILVLTVGLLLRVLLGRPWIVEAEGSDGQEWTWQVNGWHRSGAVIAAIKTAFETDADPNVAAMRAGARNGRRTWRPHAQRA